MITMTMLFSMVVMPMRLILIARMQMGTGYPKLSLFGLGDRGSGEVALDEECQATWLA